VARRILDQGLRNPEEVRREVRQDGRIRCSASSCYFPEPPANRTPPQGRPLRRSRTAWTSVPETPGRRFERWALAPVGARSLPSLPKLQGLLLGHETCVHLLPLPAAACRLGELALRTGLRLGLVLPPLFGPREARKGLALAAALLALDPTLEVTANDVGTLAALRTRLGPSVPLALGRLLVPQRNDPRLTRFPREHGAWEVLSEPPLEHLEVLFDRFRASRMEVSIPLGWPRTLPSRPMSIHLGPSLLSVARACPTWNETLQEPGAGRPFVSPESCPRPCLERSRLLRDPEGGESFRVEQNCVLADLPLPEAPLPRTANRWILHLRPAPGIDH